MFFAVLRSVACLIFVDPESDAMACLEVSIDLMFDDFW